ncbi:MAG: hypothetical protein NVSMB64_00170 [Candidatus Velthaea sp.]
MRALGAQFTGAAGADSLDGCSERRVPLIRDGKVCEAIALEHPMYAS